MFRYLEHRELFETQFNTQKERNSMKRYIWVVPVVALAAVVLFTASRRFAAGSRSINGDATPEVILSSATRGVVFATAAINTNGTVANCFTCNRVNTFRLGQGLYQVGFNTNVQANNGWSRWLQVDTLTTGSIPNVSCTTADRSGLPTGIFVECSDNATGNRADTSFFLFVAR
jgi:hypothetical protein